MEAKKVYDDIVVSFFNIIRDEKLRTKIALNSDYKAKTISLVGDLLALEKDHECTFKETQWSQLFAKAVVNITKEKIKFEKPDDKSLTDIYADYADILTVSLNLYGVQKEALMNGVIEITAEELKVNSKVSLQLKEKFPEEVIGMKEENEVEVVDQSKESPNNSNQQNQNFNQYGDFSQSGEIPLPPMQNPRFYPYKTKPKYMKLLKLIFGISFAVFTAVFVSIEIFLSLQNVKFSTGDYPNLFNNWAFIEKTGDVQPSFSLNYSLFYMLMGNGGLGIFVTVMYALIGVYVSYTFIARPKVYREQFHIQIMSLVATTMLIIIIGYKFVSAPIWESVTNQANIKSHLAKLFEDLIKNSDVNSTIPENFDESINTIYNDILLKQINLNVITALLIVEFTISLIIAILIITLFVLNPYYDKQKIIKANTEYQKVISEAMQGRKYEMDPTLFEDEIEVKNFYEALRNQQENKEK